MPKRIPKHVMIARCLELYHEINALIKGKTHDEIRTVISNLEGVNVFNDSFEMFDFNYKEVQITIGLWKDGTSVVSPILDYWNGDSPFTFNLADHDLTIKEDIK